MDSHDSRAAGPRSAWVMGALVAWLAISLVLVNLAILPSGKPNLRATILMADGLNLFWVFCGGALMRLCRNPVRRWVRGLRYDWRLKFVVFATALALLEEVVTTTMTNLAPHFGVPIGAAYITASTNYLDVVCFHSVVVIAPAFVGWALLLSWFRFHPNLVFLLFGISGLLGETSFGGLQQLGAFAMWIYVYGLMIYLPAYCVPDDRPARTPPWWAYPLAVFFPSLFVPVTAVPVGLLGHHPKSHFPPIRG